MKEVTKKKNSGLAMRLIQFFAYLLLSATGGYILAEIIAFEQMGFGDYAFISCCALMSEASLFALLQIFFAFSGNKTKGGNIASVVISILHILMWLALFLSMYFIYLQNIYLSYLIFAILGVFGLIGGLQGIKRGIFPEKKTLNGFALRFIQGIFWSLATIAFITTDVLAGGLDVSFLIIFTSLAIFFLFYSVLQFITAYKGKSSKGANVASIWLNALFIVAIVGLPGFIGGIYGRNYLKANPDMCAPPKGKKVKTASSDTAVREQTTDVKVVNDFNDLDYSIPDNSERIFGLSNEPNIIDFIRESIANGEKSDVSQIRIYDSDGDALMAQLVAYKVERKDDTYRLYIIIEGESDQGEGKIMQLYFVGRRDDGNYVLVAEFDKDIQEKIRLWYNELVAEANAPQRQTIALKDFSLDLVDYTVDEKTWKDFKKEATQEELTVIAIGAKYRVAHSRLINIISVIGIILSVALFWPTGGYSLIGYPVFAFLATKIIRYQDTLIQARRKLSKENKNLVDSFFVSNTGLKILDVILQYAVVWLTLPYQAIMMIIGLVAPNFVISKNGILVSIPKGYDVGDLAVVSNYYSSFNFIDESLATMEKNDAERKKSEQSERENVAQGPKEYTYTDENGHIQSVYSDDGDTFYNAGGHYEGAIGDGFERKGDRIDKVIYNKTDDDD